MHNLRENEEQSGGSHQECGGGGHWDVFGGFKTLSGAAGHSVISTFLAYLFRLGSTAGRERRRRAPVLWRACRQADWLAGPGY